MKKIIHLFVLTALLVFSACSLSVEKDNQPESTNTQAEPQTTTEVQIQESNDQYNANIENGLKELDLVDKE